MGAPKKRPEKKLSAVLQVRLTPAEMEGFIELASKAGQKPSAFARANIRAMLALKKNG